MEDRKQDADERRVEDIRNCYGKKQSQSGIETNFKKEKCREEDVRVVVKVKSSQEENILRGH